MRFFGKTFLGLIVGLACCWVLAPATWAQNKGKGFQIPSLSDGLSGKKVSVASTFEIEKGTQRGRLHISAKVAEGYHIYSTTQLDGGPRKTEIKIASNAITLTGPISPDQEPEIHSEEDIWPGLVIEELHGKPSWTVPFVLTGEADPNSLEIEVDINGQVCADSCEDFQASVKATFADYYTAAERVTSLLVDKTHVVWTAQLEPKELKPGRSGKLVLTAKPEGKYHVYPFVADAKSIQFRTLIAVTRKSGLKFGIPTTTAEVVTENDVKYHPGAVSWTIPIEVPHNAEPGEYPIEFKVGFYSCYSGGCDPPAGLAASGTLLVGNAERSEPELFSLAPVAFKDIANLESRLLSWIDHSGSQSLTLVQILSALIGGFILNFMPCVLPVVGLKLMSFVNQAGSSHRKVITLNLAYVAGILAVMLGLAAITIGAKMAFGRAFGWGEHFSRIEFQVPLVVLVFAMALSFLGVWEIPIPGFATSKKSGNLMEKEGHSGAFFKGILTTILATPCSGPFLGALFGLTLSLSALNIVWLYALVGIGLGFPYIALCFYPGAVKMLPKPGAWMDTFKQFMAFPLLLTVVYIVQIINPDYRIATLTLLMVVWFACWLIGRVPAYTEGYRIRNVWLSGISATIAAALVSFTYLGPAHHYLPWETYNEAQLQAYRAQGKTVMVEFTARWCQTCQWNLLWAIDRPRVEEVVKTNGVITMLADKSEPSPKIDQKLNELGSNSIPLVAIYPPGREPILLRDTLTESQVINALKEAGPSKSNEPSKGKDSSEKMASTPREVNQ